MGLLEVYVGAFLLAMVRFAPLLMVPAFTPFNWVPATIRVCVLMALAMLAIGVNPSPPATLDPDNPIQIGRAHV